MLRSNWENLQRVIQRTNSQLTIMNWVVNVVLLTSHVLYIFVVWTGGDLITCSQQNSVGCQLLLGTLPLAKVLLEHVSEWASAVNLWALYSDLFWPIETAHLSVGFCVLCGRSNNTQCCLNLTGNLEKMLGKLWSISFSGEGIKLVVFTCLLWRSKKTKNLKQFKW